MTRVAIYLCAFRSSDCCDATINRVMETELPDRFVCMKCHRLCEPVKDER